VTRSNFNRHLVIVGCSILITLVSFALILEISARLPYFFPEVWNLLGHREKAIAVASYFFVVLAGSVWRRRAAARRKRLGPPRGDLPHFLKN